MDTYLTQVILGGFSSERPNYWTTEDLILIEKLLPGKPVCRGHDERNIVGHVLMAKRVEGKIRCTLMLRQVYPEKLGSLSYDYENRVVKIHHLALTNLPKRK
jgi:hypothetical protein